MAARNHLIDLICGNRLRFVESFEICVENLQSAEEIAIAVV